MADGKKWEPDIQTGRSEINLLNIHCFVLNYTKSRTVQVEKLIGNFDGTTGRKLYHTFAKYIENQESIYLLLN